MLNGSALSQIELTKIKPSGWLLDQLRIQANGLSGKLDLFWPDIKESRWIGGSREGWERVPYWLDGFVPLARLLDDADLIKRADRYVEAIFTGQQTDGWICPCGADERKDYDLWAYFLVMKALTVYHACTGDDRVMEVLYGALKCVDGHIDKHTLFGWAQMRWFEALIPIYFVYSRKPEKWLLTLGKKLRSMGFDYKSFYGGGFPFTESVGKGHWCHASHVVNQAMAVKSAALYHRQSGDPEDLRFADSMLETLMEYHGNCAGIFTGDECLAGKNPSQGTELCAVAELMYSFENLLQLTGETKWADMLEYAAFNALPATISQDMETHQYDQQTNQISCVILNDEDNPFTSNGPDSLLFGIEPNYGCCTANFNQAWPKLACSVFFASGTNVAVALLIPSIFKTEISGSSVEIEIITDYPFGDGAVIIIKCAEPVEFSLSVRIPGFAESATIDGLEAPPGEFHKINKVWPRESVVEISLSFEFKIINRDNGLHAVRRGPLLFAIPIEGEWRRIADDSSQDYGYPRLDYEVVRRGDYAFAVYDGFTLKKRKVGEFPFDKTEPPVAAIARAYPIEWPEKGGVLSEKPASLEATGPEREIALHPYGCTTLRVAEFPIVTRQ